MIGFFVGLAREKDRAFCNFSRLHMATSKFTGVNHLVGLVIGLFGGLFYLGVFRAVFSSIICIFKDHGVRKIVNKNSVSAY